MDNPIVKAAKKVLWSRLKKTTLEMEKKTKEYEDFMKKSKEGKYLVS